jgi:hypothetical protein
MVGLYGIEAAAGSGGMGQVFKAWDTFDWLCSSL